MKPRILVLMIIAGLLFYPTALYPQWIDHIRTESDWELLYSQGYFDYNTYQIYRELAEGATVTDTVALLRAAMGNSVIEAVGNESGSSQIAASADSSRAQKYLLHIRGGQRAWEGRSGQGYLLISGNSEGNSFNFKVRKNEPNWEVERRSLSIQRGNLDITLGNYNTDVGMGLAIGRFDYRPLTPGSENPDRPDDILFPDNSFYNGIKIGLGNTSAYYSHKKYSGLNKRFVGASVTITRTNVITGFSGALTFLKNDSISTQSGAASLFFIDPDKGLTSELAYAEAGIGAAVRLRRGGYDIAAWHYDNSFMNLQSSGIASPDYIRFEDIFSGQAFRQSQSGETGFHAQKTLTIGKFDLLAVSEVWRSPSLNLVSAELASSLRYRLLDGLSLYGRISDRSGGPGDRRLLEFGPSYNRKVQVSARLSHWSENDVRRDDRSYGYIYCSIPLFANLAMSGRFRAYFDGDTDYFIEEALTIKVNYRIKATYRWQNSYGDDIGPLYIILDAMI